MVGRGERIAGWLLATNVWVSAGVTACLFASAHVLRTDLAWPTVALAFSSTLFVYNVDHLRDSATVPTGTRRASPAVLRTFVVSSAMATLVVLVISPASVRWVFLSYGSLGLIYGASMFGPFRLKQVPGLKAWIVASGATIAGVGLPLAGSGRDLDLDGLQVAIATFAWIAVNAHLCDVVDLVEDQLNDTRSLPSIVGLARTRVVLRAILTIATTLLIVGWGAQVFSWHPEILVVLAMNFALTYVVSPRMSSVAGYVIVDGTLFMGALAPLGHFLFVP